MKWQPFFFSLLLNTYLMLINITHCFCAANHCPPLFLVKNNPAKDLYGIFLVDSFIFLFLENYGVRKLEAFFAVLIATMAVSFAIMFGETKPSGKELLIGNPHLTFWQNAFLYVIFSKSKGVCLFNYLCRFGGSKVEFEDN